MPIGVIFANFHIKYNLILSTQKFCILIHLSNGMQNFCIPISVILANFHMKYNYILNTQKFCTLIHLSKGVQNFCNPISAILANFHTKHNSPKHSEILHLNPLEERDAEYF